jgi:hypothetical protein
MLLCLNEVVALSKLDVHTYYYSIFHYTITNI